MTGIPFDWKVDCNTSDDVNDQLTPYNHWSTPSNWVDDAWDAFTPATRVDWFATGKGIARRYGFYAYLLLVAVVAWKAGYYTGHLDALAGH